MLNLVGIAKRTPYERIAPGEFLFDTVILFGDKITITTHPEFDSDANARSNFYGYLLENIGSN